jgi:hypothetical protein
MILSTSTEDFKAFQIKQPRYESDHRLLLGKLKLDKKKYHRTYVRKRTIFPIKIRLEDKNPSDLLMDDLVTLINKPIKENPEYATWISPRSCTLVAAKAEARGCGNTNATKRLSKSLKKSIKTDRKARIEAVAVEIENSLRAGETHKAYKRLRGWYRSKPEHTPKPTRQDEEKTREEFETLYTEQEPPGEPIPILYQEHTPIDDTEPDDEEVCAALKKLRLGRGPGGTEIRRENPRRWMIGAHPVGQENEEASIPDPAMVEAWGEGLCAIFFICALL